MDGCRRHHGSLSAAACPAVGWKTAVFTSFPGQGTVLAHGQESKGLAEMTSPPPTRH